MYLSFVIKIMEYAIHLRCLSTAVHLDYLSLERFYLHTTIGPYLKSISQERKLLKLEHIEQRRRRILNKLLTQLEKKRSPELGRATEALKDADDDKPTKSIT